MAASKAVRATRSRHRAIGTRQRTADTSARIHREPPDHEVSSQIAMLALRLNVVYAMAVSVQLALRHQSAEFDTDLADCLRHGVCDPLADQIDAAQIILKRLGGKMPAPFP